ncbi:uncharacterized [Tachysurus ichikawai]
MRCYCGGLSASQSNYSNVSCSLKSQSPAECTAQSVLQKGKPRTALTFIIPIGYELLHVLAGKRKRLLGLRLVTRAAACWHVIGSMGRVGAERARGRGAAFPLPPLASPSPCSLSLRPSSLPDCTGLDPVPISPFDSPLFTIPSQPPQVRSRTNMTGCRAAPAVHKAVDGSEQEVKLELSGVTRFNRYALKISSAGLNPSELNGCSYGAFNSVQSLFVKLW